jgi:Skp family chaperone for outer membrane proteins
LALSLTLATSLVRAQETPATALGGYKIGVVDMREVFQKYNRRESAFNELVGQRDAAQKKVDDLATVINKEQKDYQSKKESATPDQLEELEMSILSKVSELEAERTKLQAEVSRIEDKLLSDLTKEIRAAIMAIGQAEDYHLILEAGNDGSAAVLYSATPLNLTSKVIDRLNKGAK